MKLNPIYPIHNLQVGEFYMAQVSNFNWAEFPNKRSSETSGAEDCTSKPKITDPEKRASQRRKLKEMIGELSEFLKSSRVRRY